MGAWTEHRRGALDERARARLDAALAEPPIFASPTSVAERELFAFGVWLGASSLVVLGAPARVAVSLAALALAFVARRAWVAARAARARWPEGRFLFRWGYAEVAGDVLTILPAEALDVEVIRRGPWPYAVAVRARDAPGWDVRFLLPRPDERAVPRRALSALGTLGASDEGASYREGRTPLPVGRARRARVPAPLVELFGAATLAVGIAIAGRAIPVPRVLVRNLHAVSVRAEASPAEPTSARRFRSHWGYTLRCETCTAWSFLDGEVFTPFAAWPDGGRLRGPRAMPRTRVGRPGLRYAPEQQRPTGGRDVARDPALAAR
ncbi:MAG: hypothetical protein U0234_04435 [Sandaracinus sp.]